MKLAITAALDYRLGDPVDLMLHIEAAAIPEQLIVNAVLDRIAKQVRGPAKK